MESRYFYFTSPLTAPIRCHAGDNKAPPAQVPEYQLFSLMQRHRRSLVTFLDGCSSGDLDAVMRSALRTALRKNDFEYEGWQRDGTGALLNICQLVSVHRNHAVFLC